MARLISAACALVLAAAPAVACGQSAAEAPPPPSATTTNASGQAGSADELPAICTDRPTKSNYACTVEPGRFQYETDIFNGSYLRLGGVTTDTYLATNPTLKYGLTKTIDFEANIAPYEVVRTRGKSGDTSLLGGVGDLYLRLKWNYFTSADSKWSFAALPYVKAPTARLGIGNEAVEGGVIFPINYKLTDKITLTTAPEFDAYKNGVGDGRHFNSAELINIGYSLPHNLTVYGELWGDWNHDPMRTTRQYSADTAIAWGITKYLQVDAGLNLGLNKYTPGVQTYFGVSQKF